MKSAAIRQKIKLCNSLVNACETFQVISTDYLSVSGLDSISVIVPLESAVVVLIQ